MKRVSQRDENEEMELKVSRQNIYIFVIAMLIGINLLLLVIVMREDTILSPPSAPSTSLPNQHNPLDSGAFETSVKIIQQQSTPSKLSTDPPFQSKPLPAGFRAPRKYNSSNADQFTRVYDTNHWDRSGKHPSGAGSIPEKNLDYLLAVQYLVDHPQINKIVEIGFGDFQLMHKIRFRPEKKYIGYDVVAKLMRKNQTNKEFRLYQNLFEFNETGDLLLTKDVLQHLPNKDIDHYFKNIVPRFKYVLLTNDLGNSTTIKDIKYGDYRPLNLDIYPAQRQFVANLVRIQKTYIIPRMP